MSSPSSSGTHECPGGCGAQVAFHLFACKRCWFRLPRALRTAIWRAHGGTDGRAHVAAMADATQWFEANPLPAPRVDKPPEPRLF